MKNFFKKYYKKLFGLLLVFTGSFILLYNSIFTLAYTSNEKKKIEEFYTRDVLYNDSKDLENNGFFLNVIENIDMFEDYRLDNTLNNNLIQTEDSFISVIKIPKLNLEKGLLSKDSNYSSDIKFIKDFNDSNLLIELANKYLTKLNKLELDDIIEVYYHAYKYTYKVIDISSNVIKDSALSIELQNKSIVINCDILSIEKY